VRSSRIAEVSGRDIVLRGVFFNKFSFRTFS
jgi:hypothetical protein